MKKKSTKKTFKASHSKGLPPGTLIYIGAFPDQKANIELLEYNEKDVSHLKNLNPEQINGTKEVENIRWINLNGISDVDAVERLGLRFNIHGLILEDIVNTSQRPKVEDFGEYVLVAMKMIYYEDDELRAEHVSMIMGKGYVISFQEIEGDVFGDVRERINSAKGKIRIKKSDYLLFTLLDTIVDHYFVTLEKLGERLDELEDRLLGEFTHELLVELQEYRRMVIQIRRSVYPLREAIAQLVKSETDLIEDASEKYFRDLYDHTIQIIETIESFKELISSLKDIYMSGISNRMNNIMKVLTIIATIFIPLTFIAGIYGMNFDNMPELHWKYGYFAVWSVMLVMFIGMMFFFRKKDWI